MVKNWNCAKTHSSDCTVCFLSIYPNKIKKAYKLVQFNWFLLASSHILLSVENVFLPDVTTAQNELNKKMLTNVQTFFIFFLHVQFIRIDILCNSMKMRFSINMCTILYSYLHYLFWFSNMIRRCNEEELKISIYLFIGYFFWLKHSINTKQHATRAIIEIALLAVRSEKKRAHHVSFILNVQQ